MSVAVSEHCFSVRYKKKIQPRQEIDSNSAHIFVCERDPLVINTGNLHCHVKMIIICKLSEHSFDVILVCPGHVNARRFLFGVPRRNKVSN